jgi:hypothetical protein
MSSFYGTPIRALRVPSLCLKCMPTLIVENKRDPFKMVILKPPILRTSARDRISLTVPRAKTILSPTETSVKLVRGVVATTTRLRSVASQSTYWNYT